MTNQAIQAELAVSDDWITSRSERCARVLADIEDERTRLRAERDKERKLLDYAHKNLTLSCGCKWSFVSWRYHDECADHYIAPTIIASGGDPADDAFKVRQKARGNPSTYGD